MGFEIKGDNGEGLPWKWRFRKGRVLDEDEVEKEKEGAMEGSITKEIDIVGLDLLLILEICH